MAGASLPRRSAAMRWAGPDPLRLTWRVLTSVRFALGLILFLALAALLGVLLPQLPAGMRGNSAAEAAWLAVQRDRFGFLTDPMQSLGLFQVFHTPWFVAGLALLVASVCVCTANRLPPIWRNVFKPQTRVPDDYYARGAVLVEPPAQGLDALTRELRRRRYRVSTTTENGNTYLFADRFPWAQFATFVSHLALILFLAGAFVTLITSREQQVLVAEGETALPVFALDDPDHMQVSVQDAVGRFDAGGFPLDFRSYISVFKDGKEVASGVTTVNHPLSYGGYRFHQSAFFPDGAALTVRQVSTGRVVYDQVLALTSSAATPRVVVRDATGAVLLDDLIVPTDFIADIAGTSVVIPGSDRQFWLGARPSSDANGWQLVVFETANAQGARALLTEGERLDLAGLSFSFVGMSDIPSTSVSDVPGLTGSNGVAEISDGPGGKLLTVGPVAGRALSLSADQPVTIGDYEYSFGGQREFAGITVRRDPGATFIWAATGLFLLGLGLTFYTPRRRLWGKMISDRVAFRGLGGRQAAIEKEVREVAARASRA